MDRSLIFDHPVEQGLVCSEHEVVIFHDGEGQA